MQVLLILQGNCPVNHCSAKSGSTIFKPFLSTPLIQQGLLVLRKSYLLKYIPCHLEWYIGYDF
jgi:hypothetical protein